MEQHLRSSACGVHCWPECVVAICLMLVSRWRTTVLCCRIWGSCELWCCRSLVISQIRCQEIFTSDTAFFLLYKNWHFYYLLQNKVIPESWAVVTGEQGCSYCFIGDKKHFSLTRNEQLTMKLICQSETSFCCHFLWHVWKSHYSFDWQAEDGVGIPEDVLNDTRFERAMRFYFVYLRLDWLWSLNLFALILLNFLEVSFQYLGSPFVMNKFLGQDWPFVTHSWN